MELEDDLPAGLPRLDEPMEDLYTPTEPANSPRPEAGERERLSGLRHHTEPDTNKDQLFSKPNSYRMFS